MKLSEPSRDSGLSILMVAPSLNSRGGISAVAGQLFGYLQKHEFNATYLESRCEGPFLKRIFFTLGHYFTYLFALIGRDMDMVHIHSGESLSFYRKLIFIEIAFLFRKKVIWQIHPERFVNFYMKGRGWLRKRINRCVQKSAAIIVLSEAVKRRFGMLFPGALIHVLPNPVETERYRCRKDRPTNKVLYLGRVMKEKGIFDIISLIPQVVAEVPEVRFEFCGIKDPVKFKKKYLNPEIWKHVDLKCWVSGEDKIDVLSQSTLLILPSYTEGFPVVVLEAMASCLPVITTPVGANPEIVEDGINGYLVEAGDKAGFLEKILFLLRNPDLQDKIGRTNRQAVKLRFDLEVVGAQLTEIYQKAQKYMD